jgi:eukaryotic-like serine/threonine-protein kinase
MTMMFGRFEILGELSKSELGTVYRATDTETNQTVALKTLRLDTLGEGTSAFVETLLAEGERTRELSSQHVAVLYGAGEIEGQFCAAMEYVQGNSIATMLSRKEGFSIWDLLDITRQVCAGLDQAASQQVVHSSLEPAKIMVQWDGLVKILGYGISSMSLISAECGDGLGKLLPYCSPEQVGGGTIDARSNLFTWGAILYEMVADRRAFDANDRSGLEKQVLNDMPPSPLSLNSKIHPGVSALIMKALAKNPDERYQTARELAADLEKCKEGGSRQAAAGKKPPQKPTISNTERAAAASKFVTTSTIQQAPPPHEIAVATEEPRIKAAAMAAAAGAGIGIGAVNSAIDSRARLIDEPAAHEFSGSTEPMLSAATAPAMSTPAIAVDPVMSAPAPAASGKSFSDIDELPPLKEPIFAPPPPPLPAPEPEERTPLTDLRSAVRSRAEEKPKIQPREVAQKAFTEIKTLPPQLMLYSVLGAVVLILIVAIGIYMHVRNQDDEGTAAPRPTSNASVKQETAQPTVPAAVPEAAAPVAALPAAPEPEVTVRQIAKHNARGAKKQLLPAPAMVVPGQVQVDSNPQGAQIQIDGKSDPSWVTPFNVTGLSPGQHAISVSKTGFSGDSRTVDVASGSKSFVVVHLAPINALLVVNSIPAGAEVLVDGKATGRVTPAQFAVEKGNHTVLLRKQGFLEETTSADLSPGQNFQFAPVLRALGNADEIKTVGKFKKLFGGGGDSAAGMGSVSIRTQPKGAQIALNQRLLERLSPTAIMVGPGNYVVDITLTGFKPTHKVISVEKGGKVAIDEVMERE